jgi:hypothetical protein
LRLGILPTGAILPPEQHALAEKRTQWAQERARNIPAAEERRRQCQE